MADCLMLNADYRPISLYPLSLITWKDAIRLSYLDKVQVVEYYDDWEVRSQHTSLKVPAVIATKHYINKATRQVAFSRRGIFQRDGYTCQYCGRGFAPEDLTLDHVIPSSKGGSTSWDNIVASCVPCNQKKGDTLIKPLTPPRMPDYRTILRMIDYTNKRKIKHPSWEKLLELT